MYMFFFALPSQKRFFCFLHLRTQIIFTDQIYIIFSVLSLNLLWAQFEKAH